jgi:hypothetical protein
VLDVSWVSTGQVGLELMNMPLSDKKVGWFGTCVYVFIVGGSRTVELSPQLETTVKPEMV